MNKKERLLVLILAGINFTHILDFMIMMPLGPQLMRIFEINPQQFSILVSAYTFSACIAGLIAAFFVDKFDRKKVLLFGYIGFIIGTFGCALAPGYFLLMMARIIAGLFGGLIGAQVLSIVGDAFPFERRATAMGALTAAFSVASVIGVPLGLYLANITSWHAPFVLVGGVGLVIMTLIIIYIPSMTKHITEKRAQNFFHAYINIQKDKNQQRALLLSVVMMLGHFSIIPFIAKYMVSNVGFTEQDVTYIYLVGGAATIFTAPLIGKLADKKGKFMIFALFCSLTLIPVLIITNMPQWPMYTVLTVTAFFFIFVTGRMIPMQAMVTSVVPLQQRGGFMSINSSLIQLGSGLAALTAGTIITENADGSLNNYNYVGYFAIIFSLLAILIAYKLKPVRDTITYTKEMYEQPVNDNKIVIDQVN
ncbi:MAG: MFS transporter [Fimbriimonadaceae bacterium]|nr:MFS transporter [Chitinophagales bacterium]